MILKFHQVLGVSVQFSRSVMFNSLRPHESHVTRQASLSITNSWSSLKLTSIESVIHKCHGKTGKNSSDHLPPGGAMFWPSQGCHFSHVPSGGFAE